MASYGFIWKSISCPEISFLAFAQNVGESTIPAMVMCGGFHFNEILWSHEKGCVQVRLRRSKKQLLIFFFSFNILGTQVRNLL